MRKLHWRYNDAAEVAIETFLSCALCRLSGDFWKLIKIIRISDAKYRYIIKWNCVRKLMQIMETKRNFPTKKNDKNVSSLHNCSKHFWKKKLEILIHQASLVLMCENYANIFVWC